MPSMDDEPPLDPRNWLHRALVGLHTLTRIPSPVLALAILLLAVAIAALWYAATRSYPASATMGSMFLLAVAADWVWLSALPRLRVSFGPVKPSLIGLTGVRFTLGLLPLVGRAIGLSTLPCAIIGTFIQLALWGIVFYATYVEPFRLGTTVVELVTTKLPAGKRVRLVQISDLHIERITRRERALIDEVRALDPDYVLLTGDYLNLSYVGEPQAISEVRQVLGALQAKEAIYAVRGTHQVDPNAVLSLLFEGLPIHWLRSEQVIVERDGYQVAFAGASCTRRRDIDVPAVAQALSGIPENAFTVLLYHTPDLVPEAVAGGADLYLAGHTHGGQFRLPLYGALFTATDSGKRYEMGRYDVDGLTLYVSRGLGMEGMAAPRVRFLCPPEVVCIDVRGAA